MGFDATPSFLPGLTANVTLFNVRYIGFITGTSTANALNSPSLNLIHFYPNDWHLDFKITKQIDGKPVEVLYDPDVDKVLKEVQSGRFARQWIRENAQGRGTYQKLLNEDTNRQIEKVGATLRARMPWLQEESRKGARP